MADCVKIPEGWQLVPIEPTHEMLLAYATAWEKYRIRGTTLGDRGRHEYQMMLKAAPPPPVSDGEKPA